MKYELWYSKKEGSYTMFPAGHNPSVLRTIEPDAVLLHVFDASTWEAAMQQQNEFLGWGPYTPMEEGDK